MTAEMWRVVDDAGALLWAGVPSPVPQADGSTRWSADGAGSWASQRWAVLAMAAHRHLDAAQVLAPGELTRGEAVAAAVAAETLRCQAVCREVAMLYGDVGSGAALTCAHGLALTPAVSP